MNLIARTIFAIFCIQIANSATVEDIYGETGLRIPPIPKSTKELSANEKYLLDKFRIRIGPLLKDDYEKSDEYLLGWLISSKWNVYQADQRFKRAMHWKRANKISELGKAEIPKDLFKLFHYSFNQIKDKNGCPVFEQNSGKWNVSKFILSHEYPRDGVEKYKRYGFQSFEKAENYLRTFRGRCSTYTFIGDLKGFSMNSISDFYTTSAFTALFKAMQNVYPGVLGEAIYINAPANFKDVLELLKPMVADFQVGRFSFYFGEDEWKPVLLSKIDASELPPELGGTKNI